MLSARKHAAYGSRVGAVVSGKPAAMLLQTANARQLKLICLVFSFSLFANRNRLRLSIGWGVLDSDLYWFPVPCSHLARPHSVKKASEDLSLK